MAATTNLSWAAFEQIPDDGMHRELIDGDLQVLPPAKYGHTRIAKRVNKVLEDLEERTDGVSLVEGGYKLSDDPATLLQPDVSFVAKTRADATPPDGYLPGAPELAVEIVSPSESARDLNRKISLYLKGGSLAVWVIYPEDSEVRVYLRDGSSSVRTLHQTISLPELVPSWEAPVIRFFQD